MSRPVSIWYQPLTASPVICRRLTSTNPSCSRQRAMSQPAIDSEEGSLAGSGSSSDPSSPVTPRPICRRAMSCQPISQHLIAQQVIGQRRIQPRCTKYPRVWESSLCEIGRVDCEPVPCDTPMLASAYQNSTTSSPSSPSQPRRILCLARAAPPSRPGAP